MQSIATKSDIAHLPTACIDISNFNVKCNSIYVFDFDGVISSSMEDDIYHLPSWDAEVPILDAAAQHFGIKCKEMDIKYQRHLIYQACALHKNIEIEKGPAFAILDAVKNTEKVFILTARSGWYAVERMRRFLYDNNVIPVEIFNIGRAKKDRQIELLCNEFKNLDVFYFEDSMLHINIYSYLNSVCIQLVSYTLT